LVRFVGSNLIAWLSFALVCSAGRRAQFGPIWGGGGMRRSQGAERVSIWPNLREILGRRRQDAARMYLGRGSRSPTLRANTMRFGREPCASSAGAGVSLGGGGGGASGAREAKDCRNEIIKLITS